MASEKADDTVGGRVRGTGKNGSRRIRESRRIADYDNR
jgi:hypothetical protein